METLELMENVRRNRADESHAGDLHPLIRTAEDREGGMLCTWAEEKVCHRDTTGGVNICRLMCFILNDLQENVQRLHLGTQVIVWKHVCI